MCVAPVQNAWHHKARIGYTELSHPGDAAMKMMSIAAVVALMSGCLSPGEPRRPTYDAVGAAVGGTNPFHDQCSFLARLALPSPLPAYWEGRVGLLFWRGLNRAGGPTHHDTTYSEWVTFRHPSVDSVSLTLVGPINASLSASGTDVTEFDGTWVCRADYPFADDSSVATTGSWGLDQR